MSENGGQSIKERHTHKTETVRETQKNGGQTATRDRHAEREREMAVRGAKPLTASERMVCRGYLFLSEAIQLPLLLLLLAL